MAERNDAARIAPLETPYSAEVRTELAKWMPPGSAVEPLRLFRTLVKNVDLAGRMRPLGSGILNHGLLDAHEREIVIHRVCARCRCEYEWGVHAVVYAGASGIPHDLLAATVHADSADSIWSERERLLVRLVDELHDTASVSDALWRELSTLWNTAQLLELLVAVGFYHLISFLANGARVQLEDWGARFPRGTREGASSS